MMKEVLIKVMVIILQILVFDFFFEIKFHVLQRVRA